MIDKEKVIKGLEVCLKNIDQQDCPNDCPYLSDCSKYGNRVIFQPLMLDALALLKEQEAVEPSFKQDEKGIFVWCCGSCGAYMYHIYDGIDKAKEYAKFCRQCGKQVKWE